MSSRGGYWADGEYRCGILEGDRADCRACWEGGDSWGAEVDGGPDEASEELDGHGCVLLRMVMDIATRKRSGLRMHRSVLGGVCAHYPQPQICS